MIHIDRTPRALILKYRAGRNTDPEWVEHKLKEDGEVLIRRTFTFTSKDVITGKVEDEDDFFQDDGISFRLGNRVGRFYIIRKEILGLKHDLRLSVDFNVSDKSFTAERNISIFGRIDDLVDEPISVGGASPGCIPIDDFEIFVREFPTTKEVTRYAGARITRILKDYFDTMSDAEAKLRNYMDRRKNLVPSHPMAGNRSRSRIRVFKEYEVQKFEYVRDELTRMLVDAESYSEEEWQDLIVEFLLLIFPKYIAVLKKVRIKDFYTNPAKPINRQIDLALVDVNGTMDIIEVKRPFPNSLLSTGKYRDNYTPKAELSGAVMQAEKYLFHLIKWGREGELDIQRRRRASLPAGLEVKITNPKAMIILGRDSNFTPAQKFDFEIIKRKYANMIDVMTYDDLLGRIDRILAMIPRTYFKFGS